MPGSSVSPAFQLVYIGGPTSDHHGGAISAFRAEMQDHQKFEANLD